jgi:hypothetical protein
LLQGIRFFATGEKNRCRGQPRIFAIRIRILGLDNLKINRSRFILAIKRLQTARLEIVRRKNHRRFLCLGGCAMKQRQSGSIVFLGEGRLRQNVCRGPRVFAVAMTVEHCLEILPCSGGLI